MILSYHSYNWASTHYYFSALSLHFAPHHSDPEKYPFCFSTLQTAALTRMEKQLESSLKPHDLLGVRERAAERAAKRTPEKAAPRNPAFSQDFFEDIEDADASSETSGKLLYL